MPRPPIGRVGRSAGAAEHRVAEHRTGIALSRTTSLTRVIALACVTALALAGAPAVAAAQTSSSSLASIRSSIDATANQWFAAQRRSADLDVQIQLLNKTLADDQHQVAHLRSVAEARAVQIYEDDAQGLDTMVGNDPLEVERRAALLGPANSDGQHAIDELTASVSDLAARRAELRSTRAELTHAQQDLATRRHTLDTELAALELRSAKAADRTVLAAQIGHDTRTLLAATATQPAPVATTTTSPTTSTTSAPPTVTPPPDTGAVSPHHDEPFLVCTRARESDGDYGAVSSSGYYGAYQFAPTTWNVTATHAGRLDLIGVLPSVASEYDQDEMAWSLYLWQGNAPWGGRC